MDFIGFTVKYGNHGKVGQLHLCVLYFAEAVAISIILKSTSGINAPVSMHSDLTGTGINDVGKE